MIRRRLGDGPANLLAEPQLRESGDGIDWYAAHDGEVRRFADLSDAERTETLATIDGHLAAINSLGDQLAASETSDEARLIGQSLKLSTRRPSDDFIHLVDGQPVIAAWGYEPDALASLAGFAPCSVPAVAPRVPPPAAIFASAPAILSPAAVGWSRFWGALLFGLMFLILLLMASWLLRACAPVDPSLNVATIETPAPPAPEPPPDPTPVLKASLDDEQAAEKKLKLDRGAAGRPQAQGRAVQADRAAQAAAAAGRRQGAAASTASAAAARRCGATTTPRHRHRPGRRPARCRATGQAIRVARA